jgi:hypothetical protein
LKRSDLALADVYDADGCTRQIHLSIIGDAARRSWRHMERKTLREKEIDSKGGRMHVCDSP